MTDYSYQYDYNNYTNQQPDVRFTNVAMLYIVNDTNTQNTRAEYMRFQRMDYQHNLIDYIDDLSNVNMDEWDIYGIPWLYLIQPDGTFAWDPCFIHK